MDAVTKVVYRSLLRRQAWLACPLTHSSRKLPTTEADRIETPLLLCSARKLDSRPALQVCLKSCQTQRTETLAHAAE